MASGRSPSPDARIATIASRQFGLATRGQALACGFSSRTIDHRVESGRWLRVHPGVYLIAGAPESWRQKVLAACLAAGPHAVASGLTAGALWKIIGRRSSPIEVTVPFRKHARADGFIVHRTRLGTTDAAEVDRIPVLSPMRTLVDLGDVLPFNQLELAFDAALRKKLTTLEELDASLPRIRRRGVPALLRMVADRVPGKRGSGSDFETQVRQILREGGVPLPTRQHEIRIGADVIGYSDLAYPAERVIIESDGYEEHSSRQAFEYDRVRQNAIVRAGYLPLRFTWADLGRPRYVCDTVVRILFERGHADVVSL